MDAGVWWIVGFLLFTGFVWWVTWEGTESSQEGECKDNPDGAFPRLTARFVVGMIAAALWFLDMFIVSNLVILPGFHAPAQRTLVGFVPLLLVSFLLPLHFVLTFGALFLDISLNRNLIRSAMGLFLFPCATISTAFIFSLALFAKTVDGPVFSCAPSDMEVAGCERGVPEPFLVIVNVLCVITACSMVPIIGHVVFYPEKEKESAGRWFPPAAGKAKRTE